MLPSHCYGKFLLFADLFQTIESNREKEKEVK